MEEMSKKLQMQMYQIFLKCNVSIAPLTMKKKSIL